MSYITYTVTVKNDDPQHSTRDVIVSIPDPTGLTYDSIISGTGWDAASRKWIIDELNPGNEVSLEIRYTVTTMYNNYSLAADIISMGGNNVGVSSISSDVVPWWLAGSIDPIRVAGAWQAVGASTIANSYINLNDPGTDDLATSGPAPSFNTLTGWTFNGTNQALINTGVLLGTAYSMILAVSADTSSDVAKYIAGTSETGEEFLISATAGGNANYQKGLVSGSKAGGTGIRGIVRLTDGSDYVLDPANPGQTLTPALGIGAITGTIGFAIGAERGTFGQSNFAACTIKAAVVYNTELSAAQVLAVGLAMAAL